MSSGSWIPAVRIDGSLTNNTHDPQLRMSARLVTACLTNDEQQIPDPWDLLQSSYSRDYLPPGSAGETHLQIRQVHIIPDILMSQFEGQDCRCFMGLFPEIGRVWMTVDNRLFLWDYATGRDYTCFDELTEVIIDVALVKPKDGIFVPAIKHLLTVVTGTEIVLLGISFDNGDGSSGDLVVHRTGLHFPTDDINMLIAGGSRTGRIFTGGQDGNLYEFAYQSEEGWFTRKCRKLNRTSSALSYLTPTFLRLSQSNSAIISLAYDCDRNLLYALGADSSIQVFFLGLNDSSFERISHTLDIYQQASRLCPNGILSPKNFKIVSINAVRTSDSAFIHLVAITNGGIKLYFTTLKRDERAYSRSQLLSISTMPSTFELVHVRLPVEEGRYRDARRMVHTWSPNIHTALYHQGVTLAANATSDQEDVILVTLPNQAVVMSQNRTGSLESTMDISVEGKVWEIAEQPRSKSEERYLNISTSFSEVVSPLVKSTRNFLLLTNGGVYVFTKSTPVEELRRILIDSNGNVEGEALGQFFDAYSPNQACFLCIVLACAVQSAWKSFGNAPGHSNIDSKTSSSLALWCVTAMMRLGGEPRAIETSISGVDYVGLSTGALGRNITNLPAYGSRIEYEFSHLHRGLYLYFSRLVGAFWNQPLIKYSNPSTEILLALHSYSEFLERNSSLSSRSHTTSATHVKSSSMARDKQQRLDEAFTAENQSIGALLSLVRMTLELSAFLSICRDYNILEAVIQNNPDLGRIEFEELLATPRGHDMIADIGAALVQKQLKLRSSVDSLCQVLTQRCPTFFGESETIVYQATECLERAGQIREPVERTLQLEESLKMFLKGSSSISLPLLGDICRKYERLAFFQGVIELCLSAAQAHDPDNISLVVSRSPDIQLNTHQQETVNLRDSIYSLIFGTLKAVHGVESRTIATTLGEIGILKAKCYLNILDLEHIRKETLTRAIRSRDELFHFRLYEWLVSEQLSSLILDIQTPFLVQFLERKFMERSDQYKDILWKYLARHGRFLDAAKILDQLALSPEFKLDLADRIERLSLALGNARSKVGMTLEAADYVQDLEERLDVAKIQNEILEQVLSQYGKVSEVAELNCTLFDVSQLFNRFSKPLKLWECSLSIIHCSSYQDFPLVHQLWTNILDKAVSGKRFDVLAQKIAELSKKLYPSQFAFPLNFVLDSVMNIAVKNTLPADWVASSFLHSGIPVCEILKQLVEFASFQSNFWSKVENRDFLVDAFIKTASKAIERSLIDTGGLIPIVDALLKAKISPTQVSRLSLLQESHK